MAHFASPFVVTPDHEKGLIRLSVLGSEVFVREHWLEPWEVRSAIEGSDHTNWVGDGRLQIKIVPSTGSVSLHTNGTRDVIRTTRGNARMLIAQLRAALKGLGEVVASKEQLVGLEQVRAELGQVSLQGRESEARIMRALEGVMERMAQLMTSSVQSAPAMTAAPAPAPSASALPITESVFIPSPDDSIMGSVLAIEATSSSIKGAKDALKEIS